MTGTDDHILNYTHNFDKNLDVMANNLVMELINILRRNTRWTKLSITLSNHSSTISWVKI